MDSARIMLANARNIVSDPSVHFVTYAYTSVVLGNIYFSEGNIAAAIAEHKKAAIHNDYKVCNPDWDRIIWNWA